MYFDNFAGHILLFIDDTTESISGHASVVHNSFETCDVSKNVLAHFAIVTMSFGDSYAPFTGSISILFLCLLCQQ